MVIKNIGLVLGPISFIIIHSQIFTFQHLPAEGMAVLSVAIWMAIWWISESIPIAATSLLPIVLLPLSGGAPIQQVTAAYGDKMLFLFMGGFIIAIAMQKWNLHKRIALNIIKLLGTKPSRLILGFMIGTGFLSMWISNTATTLLMITIATSIISQTKDSPSFQDLDFFKALLLSIAFSASIGGVATLIGTPTNPILVSIVASYFEYEIPFFDWLIFALPFSVMMILITWVFLTKIIFKTDGITLPVSHAIIREELDKMGAMSNEEKKVAWVFGVTAVCWMLRSSVLNLFIPSLNDTTIAIAASLLLFIIPSSEKKKFLLTWNEAEKLPWGVIILFGGGLALASAFKSSGLAEWFGNHFVAVQGLPLFLIIVIIAITVNFLTEITSNVATVSITLPVLASLSILIDENAYLLMVPATMAASCAFMLPVATAPNAIVFGAGYLSIRDMVKSGLFLNLISTFLISMLVYFVVPYIL